MDKVTKHQYLEAWSLVRALHHYARVDVYGDLLADSKALPVEAMRIAARHFNQQRKYGVIHGGNGYPVMILHCPECGRMMLPGGVDDVSAPASAGPYGDPMCQICANRAWREAEESYDDDFPF